MRRFGKTFVAALAASAMLGLVACGGDDSDSGGSGSADASTTGTGPKKLDGGGETFVYLGSAGSADFIKGLESSFLPAFGEQNNYTMKTDTFCCGIEKLKAQVAADKVVWGAIDFATLSDFRLAKEAGLLEKLDTSIIPVDQLREGTYDEYGYHTYIAGAVVAWQPENFPDGGPTTFEDLFDTEKFPGKRCLYKYPQFGGTLEGALLADGVSREELYPLDLDRAFDKLSEIKDDIVWWESGSQASQLLLNGNCKLAAMWSGVAQSAARENDVEIAWPNAVVFAGANAIPKNSPHPEAAQQLLADIITDKEAQAKFYEQVAYTIPLKDPQIPASVAKWAPEGKNLEEAVEEDDDYYFDNIAEITKRFNAWLVTGE